jgi:outer membrane translocation and assembly module TamA
VWQNRGEINWDSAHKDASIFLGLDTLVGPLYLATGYDDSGRLAFYLVLGRTF